MAVKMRNLILLSLVLSLFASQAMARNLKRKVLTVTSGTNTAATVTDSFSDRGYIEEIRIDVPTGSITGSIGIAINPEQVTLADIAVVDMTAFTADAIYLPAHYRTDSAGNELTNGAPARYVFLGDTIEMTMTNASASNLTFNAVILYSQE